MDFFFGKSDGSKGKEDASKSSPRAAARHKQHEDAAVPYRKQPGNSKNHHFVNHLCAYLRYNNIPELFTFLTGVANIPQ